MLQRIRKEPKQYRLTLASNLAVSAGEVDTESATLQATADLLVEELRSEHAGNGAELALTSLAEFAFYRHIRVSLDDLRYRAELVKLDDQARTRASADFTLADTNGKPWHLKDLGGKIVLADRPVTSCVLLDGHAKHASGPQGFLRYRTYLAAKNECRQAQRGNIHGSPPLALQLRRLPHVEKQ